MGFNFVQVEVKIDGIFAALARQKIWRACYIDFNKEIAEAICSLFLQRRFLIQYVVNTGKNLVSVIFDVNILNFVLD